MARILPIYHVHSQIEVVALIHSFFFLCQYLSCHKCHQRARYSPIPLNHHKEKLLAHIADIFFIFPVHEQYHSLLPFLFLR